MAGVNLTHARRYARRKALQALYQWQFTGDDPGELVLQFQRSQEDMEKADLDYFRELIYGAINQQITLDASLAPYLDRPLDQVDPIERAILRIGMFELDHRIDVPYRVVLNEAVELAKLFGAEQAHKFVNGVLDKAAQQHRSVEVSAEAARPLG